MCRFAAKLAGADQATVPESMYGVLAVYRVMSGEVAFHLLLALIMIGVARRALHTSPCHPHE